MTRCPPVLQIQAHNPLTNHFHPFLTSRMLISSDMISHSVFSTALTYQNLSNFPIIFLTSVQIFTFPSFFHRFSQHFPIIFPSFSTSFPPVFHHFGHLRGGRGLNAAIDACASAGETSQGWRLLRLAEGIPRGARDVSSLPWALARPRGMARRDGGIGSDQMRERERQRERDVYVYIYIDNIIVEIYTST